MTDAFDRFHIIHGRSYPQRIGSILEYHRVKFLALNPKCVDDLAVFLVDHLNDRVIDIRFDCGQIAVYFAAVVVGLCNGYWPAGVLFACFGGVGESWPYFDGDVTFFAVESHDAVAGRSVV